ncbi:MAG: arsenical-resistance protein, partial [Microcoleaceae cyanobacterium]
MTKAAVNPNAVKAGGRLSIFEKYLTVWVFLCIIVGIALGRIFPGVAVALDAMSIYQISIP